MTSTITQPLSYVIRAASRNWRQSFIDSILDALGHFDREPAMLTAENAALFFTLWFDHDDIEVEEGDDDFMVRFAFPTDEEAMHFYLRWL